MAGDGEQGKKAGSKKGGTEKEVEKDEKPKAINLDDHYSIKRVLDDAVSEMQEVAVGHYKGFISAADAVQSVSQEIASIGHHLIAEVLKLTKGCNDFVEEAQQLLEHHKLIRTLMANLGTLLDLLEIPQLMDTEGCVRNGNYDEALDREAFVTKLSTTHPRLPVIQSLADDVGQTTKSLLAQILL